MRLAGSVLTLAALSLAAAGARAGDPSAAPGGLQGRWLVAHRAHDSSSGVADVARVLTDLGTRVEFRGGKLKSLDPGKERQHLLYVLVGESAGAKAIDLKVPGKDGQVLRGIYRIEEGVLSLAVGTGGARPTDFTGSGDQVLLVLVRAPQADRPGD